MLTHQQGESDRGELQYPFGMMEQFPTQLAVTARGQWFMPLLWPTFSDVPVSKTLEDLRQLDSEIMPQVNTA